MSKEHADELYDARFVKEAGRFSKTLERFGQADAAKIKYKPTVKPETVAKKLVQAGRRYFENTGGKLL
jgi:hypothetical protein